MKDPEVPLVPYGREVPEVPEAFGVLDVIPDAPGIQEVPVALEVPKVLEVLNALGNWNANVTRANPLRTRGILPKERTE